MFIIYYVVIIYLIYTIYNINIYAYLFICFIFRLCFASGVKPRRQLDKCSKIQMQQFLKFSYFTDSWNTGSEYLFKTNMWNKLSTIFKVGWLVDDNK